MKKQILAVMFLLLSAGMIRGQQPDIVAVKGPDVFASTRQAVTALGGMERFVKPGQKVGVLVNAGFREKGAYVNPDVVFAALEMIYQAGASEVVILKRIDPEYWTRSPLEPKYRDMIARTRIIMENTGRQEFTDSLFTRIDSLSGAKVVSGLEIVSEFFEVDVFINIPIAKNHIATVLTNSMKNMMGLNTRASNVTFHLNGPARNDPQYLSQSIADLNLLRKMDLIISDVTCSIVTNGPNGPGDLVEPGKVVAGTDPVAVDAYCAEQIGFLAEDVLTIQIGHEMGHGQKDLAKVNILEMSLEQ